MFNELFDISNELFQFLSFIFVDFIFAYQYFCVIIGLQSVLIQIAYNLFKSSQDFLLSVYYLKSWLVELLTGRQKWTTRAEVRV